MLRNLLIEESLASPFVSSAYFERYFVVTQLTRFFTLVLLASDESILFSVPFTLVMYWSTGST